jgi:hypothetical protein
MNATNNNTPAVLDSNIVRPISQLETLYAFRGEYMEKAGDVTTAEAIRYGVSLVNRGEETKARGVFVLADKLRSQPDDSSRAAFRDALKSELINEAKERAVALCGKEAKPKDLEKAKSMAHDEAVKRFDNLGQTLRAAQWMLANPSKVADSVSVFTVQQANAYLEAPKEGASGAAEKLAIQKAVLPLLTKPGTSQGAIKAAVAAAKEKIEAAKAPVDNRTEAQKKAEAQTANIARLSGRVELITKDIDSLIAEGVKADGYRSPQLAEAVKALALLAGLKVS